MIKLNGFLLGVKTCEELSKLFAVRYTVSFSIFNPSKRPTVLRGEKFKTFNASFYLENPTGEAPPPYLLFLVFHVFGVSNHGNKLKKALYVIIC